MRKKTRRLQKLKILLVYQNQDFGSLKLARAVVLYVVTRLQNQSCFLVVLDGKGSLMVGLL